MAILILRQDCEREEDPALAALDRAVQNALIARSAYAFAKRPEAEAFDVEFDRPPGERARAVCRCGAVYTPYSLWLMLETDISLPEGEEPLCAFSDPWDIRAREEHSIDINIDMADEVVCQCGAILPMKERFNQRLSERSSK